MASPRLVPLLLRLIFFAENTVSLSIRIAQSGYRFGPRARSFFAPFAMSNRRPPQAAFTLVEIMIVIALIALLAALALPGFLRARERSQAVRIRNDLRMIETAVDQYAIETNKKAGDPVAVVDWTNYVKKGSLLFSTGEDLLGNDYGP